MQKHATDAQILALARLPSPTELLRRARLRYLGTISHSGQAAEWGLLATDHSWWDLVRDDCNWLWTQLHHCSSLQDPRSHFPAWRYLIQHHPGYWKRLVARGCEHAVRQRCNVELTVRIRRNILSNLSQHGRLCADEPAYTRHLVSDRKFGCMQCRRQFASRGGEGAHMFKCHGIVAPVRRLHTGTNCPACLKEFHRRDRLQAHLQAHLQHVPACRQALVARRFRCDVAPGIGSAVQHEEARVHDGLAPPLRAQGPVLPALPPQDICLSDSDLIVDLVTAIDERASDFDIEEVVRTTILRHPVSWTVCVETLQCFLDDTTEEFAGNLRLDCAELRRVLQRLMVPSAWTFLNDDYVGALHADDHDRHLRLWCSSLLQKAASCAMWTSTVSPQPHGRDRIILHAFAGRRRPGDFQWYIEQLMQQSEGILLHVVSLDLMIDAHFGDLSKPEVQSFWIRGIYQGWVHGFLGGPPCSTWSRARGVAIDGAAVGLHQPRIVRDADNLWGLPSLALRELTQVTEGNLLLGFCLEALCGLAVMQRTGLLEHPAEPDEPELASIWRLDIVQILLLLPGVERHRFSQGLLGADSTKPTDLLAVNLPTLQQNIRSWRLTADLPRKANIGRDSHGQFRTTHLKEYPPALCAALAASTVTAVTSHPIEPFEIDAQFLSQRLSMDVGTFSEFIGPDFAG